MDCICTVLHYNITEARMEKTTNYQLNQWAAADAVRREDFNADNAKIDAAVAAVRDAANAERVAVGSYVGDGAASRTIALPFAPKFALVLGQVYNDKRVILLLQGQDFYISSSVWYSSPDNNIQLQNDTFVIQNQGFSNQNGTTFNYILFR